MTKLNETLMYTAIFGLAIHFAHGSPDWGYEEGAPNGPENWHTLLGYENCGGSAQSPIDVKMADVVPMEAGPFELINYEEVIIETTIINNGHTAKINIPASIGAQVSGGGLDGIYDLVQIHFHWGLDLSTGSEHSIDGEHWPMEMHLVHTKAEHQSVKYAVIAVFFAPGSNQTPGLHILPDAVSQLVELDSELTIGNFAPADFVPANMDVFMQYAGSLTTPTCDETVTWSLIKTPAIVDPSIVGFSSKSL